MKIVKALLFTMLLFAITFALVALPVYFGEIGAGVLLVIIFLMICIRMFYGI